MHFTRHATCCQGAALGLPALAMAGTAHAGDNPGHDRPGIGFSPAVLQAGDVTWEQDLPDFSRNDDNTLHTADTLLRVGAGVPLALQLGTSWNRLSAPGDDASARARSAARITRACWVPRSTGSGMRTMRWALVSKPSTATAAMTT